MMKSAIFIYIALSILSSVACGFQIAAKSKFRWSSSTTTQDSERIPVEATRPASALAMWKKDPDSEDAKKKKKSEPMTLDELSRREMEASRKNMAGLLFSFQFGDIVNKLVVAFGWCFVLLGIIIESQGYAYVVDNGQLRIGTIEERDFNKEMMSSERQQKKLQKQQRLLEQQTETQRTTLQQ